MPDLSDPPVVIAGGSGFLGSSLARHLSEAGRAVIVLSRNRPTNCGLSQHVAWVARTVGDWRHALNGAAGIVNLVGRTVDCIKTPDHRDEILRSRVESVHVLGAAMRSIESPPPVWVQMSTTHIYGDPPEVCCNEDSSFGYGLAPDVARAWEAAFRSSVLPSQRIALSAGSTSKDQLCRRSELRGWRRGAVTAVDVGKAGVRRHRWLRKARHELDS